jgi:hypothetical protein
MQRSIVFLFVLACAEEPTAAKRCEQVRDRVIELRLADAVAVDRNAHRSALEHALGEDFVSSCRNNLTAMQQKCVLKAQDSASADACASVR